MSLVQIFWCLKGYKHTGADDYSQVASVAMRPETAVGTSLL